MKKWIVLLFIFWMHTALAQEKNGLASYFLVNVGYANLNGNYFKAGPEVYLVQSNGNLIGINASANMAYFKDKFVVVPEIGVAYQFNARKLKNRTDPYREYIHANFYSIRLNASPWNITPEIGISLISILEANVGYSFEIQKHDYTHFEGFKFGITLHIPTIALFGEKGFH